MHRILELVALLSIIVVALLPAKFLVVFKRIEVQVIVGLLLVGVLVYDLIAGFLFGVAIAVIYMRLNKFTLSNISSLPSVGSLDKEKYVTEEHLLKAQTNIVDPALADKGFKGMDGAYGAQAIDDPVKGFDPLYGQYSDNIDLKLA